MGQRQQRERLTEQDQNDSGNHRITDELIRPVHDEHTRRIPRRECALPLGRKPPHGSHDEDKAQAEQSEPDHLEEDGADRVTEGWCHAVPPGDPNGNEYDNCERKDRDREQMTEERSHSTALPAFVMQPRNSLIAKQLPTESQSRSCLILSPTFFA